MPEYLKVSIAEDVIFGENVRVVEPVNIYGCQIGDNTSIGPFVEIQSDVRIGNRVKIQSHTFICSLVSVGDDCFVGHGVMFTNDTFKSGSPSAGNKSKWKETKVGARVSIGSNATILPVEICDDVVIGAGSVVTKNIVKAGYYAGSPAKELRLK